MRQLPRLWCRAVAVAIAAVFFAASPSPAAAESPQDAGLDRLGAAIRVSAGFGVLEEYSWSYPGVDLVGTVRFGPGRRGYVDLQLGLAPLDNHTYLADGRTTRAALVAGVRALGGNRLRAGGLFALEDIAFHADPDVLAEHPGVDLLVGRGGLTPAAGLEASYELGRATALGLFARASLTELTLFDAPSGERATARLILVGFFIESRVR